MAQETTKKPRTFEELVSQEEIKRRKDWLDIDQDLEKGIKPLDDILKEDIDALMQCMYEHFLANEHSRSYFPNQEILERAKAAQKKYFLRLTNGDYGPEYVTNRIKVGEVHYRTGLDTTWYLGAYRLVIDWFIEKLLQHHREEPDKAAKALRDAIKLIFFDMGLAIDSYASFKEEEIRKTQDSISRLESESRVTKSILESAPVGIVRLNEKFLLEEFNEEFLTIAGISNSKNLEETCILDLLPGLDAAVFEKVLKEGDSHKEPAKPLLFKDFQELRFFDWAVWPTRSPAGENTGLVAMFTNVTDTVKLQQQREDFVATLTHDLKTPLIAANRALRLINEGQFGEIDESQKELVETILESNNDMYQMVVTLLDVYKYDSGTKRLNKAPANIVEILTKIHNEFLPLSQSRQIELIFNHEPVPELVLCDKNEVKRVLQNLLDNSLKYTNYGGTITVSLKQEDDQTLISVSDNGKGISEEDKPKLFQRFWQASNSGRYYASTGLGLYLCRKIIESHGGKIWCASELGKGSSFQFSLPNLSYESQVE